MKLAKRISVVLLVVYAGCSDPICGCSPVTPWGGITVRGAVVDMAMNPVSNATVVPVGPVLLGCTTLGGDPSRLATTTDALGQFLLWVEIYDPPGTHCVDFEASSASGAFTDTIFDVPLEFRLYGMPEDTADVTWTVSW